MDCIDVSEQILLTMNFDLPTTEEAFIDPEHMLHLLVL